MNSNTQAKYNLDKELLQRIKIRAIDDIALINIDTYNVHKQHNLKYSIESLRENDDALSELIQLVYLREFESINTACANDVKHISVPKLAYMKIAEFKKLVKDRDVPLTKEETIDLFKVWVEDYNANKGRANKLVQIDLNDII